MNVGQYESALNGPQMDEALLDMANHTSERYAKGTVTINGETTPVGEGEVGYEDNAKYYMEQAARYVPDPETALAVVRYDVPQVLTDEEKAQVQENIGGVGEGAVRYDEEQTLTDSEKAQARANIDAIDIEQNAYMLAFDGFISPEINGVKNYWDGTNYHRRIARVDLGSLTWRRSSNGYFYADKPLNAKSSSVPMCSKMEGVPPQKIWDDRGTNVYEITVYLTDIRAIYGLEENTSTFKQAMSGVFLYYELATEQVLNIDANGLRYELLWENASPTSAFAAQTISLDLSKYHFIAIIFADNTTSTNRLFEILPMVNNPWMIAITITNSGVIQRRGSQLISNRVDFDNATKFSTYGTSTTDNSVMIPITIYGIR